MIIILGFICFIGLLFGIIKLLPHFSRFIIRRGWPISFQKEWQDMGTVGITLFVTVVMAGTGLLFYKFCGALLAYFLSDDLTSFFISLRNVFSIAKDEFRNPFIFKNILSGWLLTPVFQFASIYLIYFGIRQFMGQINKRYTDSVTYTASDLFYFSFIAVLLFAMFDILLLSQDIPFVSSSAHHIFIGLSNIAVVLFYLSISHINLLNVKRYRESIPSYVLMTPKIEKVIFSPWRILILTYIIALVLRFPYFTGTQFIENNWLIIFTVLVTVVIAYFILRKFLSRGLDYLGVIMLKEGPRDLGPEMEIVKPEKEKRFYYVVALVALLFMLFKLKLFFFFATLILMAVSVILLILSGTYLLGYCVSFIRAKIFNYRMPQDPKPMRSILKYLIYASKSYIQSSALMLGAIFLILSVLTFFPKPIDFNNDEFVNYVIDDKGKLLLSEYSNSNPSFPISHSELPPFLLKCLLTQEDRSFKEQGGWLPNLSNWHGFSFAMFYRFLTGGGGSNLNQQLVKNMAFDGEPPRDIQRKLAESLTGYLMSIQCDTDDILTAYLNTVSFCGGRSQSGIVHAAYHNFGSHVRDLNDLETMYLVATLRRGANFITEEFAVEYSEAGYYATEIKETLIGIAQEYADQGLWSKKELNKLKIQELRFVTEPIPSSLYTSSNEFFLRSIKNIGPREKSTFNSTLSFDNQEKINTAIREFEMKFQSRLNANDYHLYSSAVIVDVKRGQIIGHYGGDGVTDLSFMGNGNPIGSVIKPFLIMELLERQGLNPESVRLYDGTVPGKDTPNNANGRYSNQYVDINTVLKKSLNAPIVNIREYVPPIDMFKSVEERFADMGIKSDDYVDLNDQSKYGENEVNYPLGSRNMILLDIAQIYQALFNGGEYIELTPFSSYTCFSGEKISLRQRKRQVYQPDNADAIKSALRYPLTLGGTAYSLNSMLPAERTYYAKTGTTEDARHGYTILSDGETLIVAWASYCKVANGQLKCNDSPPIPGGSGAKSAGVLAAMIYKRLQEAN